MSKIKSPVRARRGTGKRISKAIIYGYHIILSTLVKPKSLQRQLEELNSILLEKRLQDSRRRANAGGGGYV